MNMARFQALVPALLGRSTAFVKTCCPLPLRDGFAPHLSQGEVSEYELQSELDLPRGRGRLGNHAGRGANFIAVENDLIGVREIGVIENVEGLGPELQIDCLPDGELLEQRRVEVDQARTA